MLNLFICPICGRRETAHHRCRPADLEAIERGRLHHRLRHRSWGAHKSFDARLQDADWIVRYGYDDTLR